MLALILRIVAVLFFAYISISLAIFSWNIGNMAGLLLAGFSGMCMLTFAGDIWDSIAE